MQASNWKPVVGTVRAIVILLRQYETLICQILRKYLKRPFFHHRITCTWIVIPENQALPDELWKGTEIDTVSQEVKTVTLEDIIY